MTEDILIFCELASARKLESTFPHLKESGYCIESPKTPSHNCIAYAAGKRDQWWWPAEDYYWPINQKEESLSCFIMAYETEGFEVCENGDLESEIEKIAIYVDGEGTPLHAAVQLPTGRWKSKCGGWEDIEHNTPEAVGGLSYGSVGQFMKRLRHKTSDT